MKQFRITITSSHSLSVHNSYFVESEWYDVYDHLRSIRNKYYDLGLVIKKPLDLSFTVILPKGSLTYEAVAL